MYIDVDINDDVCYIYLNRLSTNSLNQEMLDELFDKVCWASEYQKIRVVILTSKLHFGFSSGLDLGSFMDTQQTIFAEKVYNAVYKSYQIGQSILKSPKIFIAALAGPVIGCAASIAFACDFRTAAPGTWFWLPDTQYGGLLADGSIKLLTKLIGNSRTAMFIMTNDRINLDFADQWGLIYKIAERNDLEKTTLSFAKRLCGYSYQTLSLHKQNINKGALDAFNSEQMKKNLESVDTYNKLKFLTRYKYDQ